MGQRERCGGTRLLLWSVEHRSMKLIKETRNRAIVGNRYQRKKPHSDRILDPRTSPNEDPAKSKPKKRNHTDKKFAMGSSHPYTHGQSTKRTQPGPHTQRRCPCSRAKRKIEMETRNLTAKRQRSLDDRYNDHRCYLC